MKISVFIIIGFLVLCFVLLFFCSYDDEPQHQKYKGPVPEGYDEKHFRETGETILLEENT